MNGNDAHRESEPGASIVVANTLPAIDSAQIQLPLT